MYLGVRHATGGSLGQVERGLELDVLMQQWAAGEVREGQSHP